MPKYPFVTDDAFLFESMIGQEKRLTMESATYFAQTQLEPRALEGNQGLIFHEEIPGEMGRLGTTLPPGYGGCGVFSPLLAWRLGSLYD